MHSQDVGTIFPVIKRGFLADMSIVSLLCAGHLPGALVQYTRMFHALETRPLAHDFFSLTQRSLR